MMEEETGSNTGLVIKLVAKGIRFLFLSGHQLELSPKFKSPTALHI